MCGNIFNPDKQAAQTSQNIFTVNMTADSRQSDRQHMPSQYYVPRHYVNGARRQHPAAVL